VTGEMDDLGPIIAWRALDEGTPVYDPDGKAVGVVEEVVAPGEIFEGIVVHTRPLPGRHVLAEHHQIAELHERGVVLAVDRSELQAPPGPRRRERATPEPRWQARLRRAWDWLSGHRA
jgi:hypothetical protein